MDHITESKQLYPDENKGIEHKCDFCEKTFSHAFSLTKHIKLVHEVQNEYKCMLCDKYFESSEDLKNHLNRHMKTVHEGLKNHKCDFCGNFFSLSWILKHHVNSVHKGKNNYISDNCGKSFSELENLQKHPKVPREIQKNNTVQIISSNETADNFKVIDKIGKRKKDPTERLIVNCEIQNFKEQDKFFDNNYKFQHDENEVKSEPISHKITNKNSEDKKENTKCFVKLEHIEMKHNKIFKVICANFPKELLPLNLTNYDLLDIQGPTDKFFVKVQKL